MRAKAHIYDSLGPDFAVPTPNRSEVFWKYGQVFIMMG